MNAPSIPMSFLIVDDNPMMIQCLRNYLVENGHSCTCLLDSTKVIPWLEQNSCDAVLSDMRMPEVDGLALTGMIRKMRPALPILISTSLGYDEELLQASLKAGASGYISKVMGPRAVLNALIQATSRPVPATSQVAA